MGEKPMLCGVEVSFFPLSRAVAVGLGWGECPQYVIELYKLSKVVIIYAQR
jgi:hypothetical protein